MTFTSKLVLALAAAGWASSPARALEFKHGKAIMEEFEDYRKCQERTYSGDVCVDALKVWLKTHGADSFQAGKLVRKTASHWVAIPYFLAALENKNADAKCDDEDLGMAVQSAVQLPKKNAPRERVQAIKIYCALCAKTFRKPTIATKRLCQ